MKKLAYFTLITAVSLSFSCGDIATGDESYEENQEAYVDENGEPILDDNGEPMVAKVDNGKTKKGGGDVLKFKQQAIVDSWGTGGTAFTILVPSGWNTQGQVIWTLECPAMPAYGIMQATSPDGKKKFELFPTQVFLTSPDPYFNAYVPEGARDHGALITKSVPDCISALKYWVVQQYRGNVKILEEKTLSQPQYYQMQGSNSMSQPGLVRIEYTENGVVMEEHIYGGFAALTSTMDGVTNWWLSQCYGFKAPKNEMAKSLPMFQTMVSSFKTDPLWYSAYKRTSDQLIAQGWQQIAANARAAQSRIKSNTASSTNEVGDIIMNGWKSRQASEDKMHDNFTNYIRGVDNYSDPTSGNTYKLPTGYNNAYTNNLGEYIISNDPNFNHHSLSGNWTELNKQ